MKKLNLFILYILLSQLCFAQQNKDTTISRKGFSLEPYFGLGASESVQGGTDKLGGRIGCGVVYMFNNHWGISSGLQVQQYSTKIISGKDSGYFTYPAPDPSFWDYNSVTVSYSFSYIELPLTVRYVNSPSQKIGFYCEAGFIIGYLISSREAGTLYDNYIDTTKYPLSAANDFTESYEKTFTNTAPKTTTFNIGSHLALGAFIPISKRFSIIIDVSIDKGLADVGNSSNDFVNTPFNGLFYYYKKTNNLSGNDISNYGTNFSALLNIRLNIKL